MTSRAGPSPAPLTRVEVTNHSKCSWFGHDMNDEGISMAGRTAGL